MNTKQEYRSKILIFFSSFLIFGVWLKVIEVPFDSIWYGIYFDPVTAEVDLGFKLDVFNL